MSGHRNRAIVDLQQSVPNTCTMYNILHTWFPASLDANGPEQLLMN